MADHGGGERGYVAAPSFYFFSFLPSPPPLPPSDEIISIKSEGIFHAAAGKLSLTSGSVSCRITSKAGLKGTNESWENEEPVDARLTTFKICANATSVFQGLLFNPSRTGSRSFISASNFSLSLSFFFRKF